VSAEEDGLAQILCDLARSLFDRGLTPGTSGNISARRPGGGFLVTPTNASLGRLRPERLAVLDEGFGHVGGDPPTKELPLHRAFYLTRG
jgi:ribulose-5-phosphate 4-epimerase/fuculose-1-phosphate aldolase